MRGASHTVRFELPGYRVANGYLDPLPGDAVYGNIALGGAAGMLVDLQTGAAWTLVPDSLAVVLEPDSPGGDPDARTTATR